MGKDGIEISILQYADDTIFFCEASMQNLKVLKAILRSFEMVSGLKINYAKSQFGAIRKSAQWLNEAALYLNCGLLAVPFTYLGIPIKANPKSYVTWEPIVKKCESRLAKWKQKPLSFGSRVTLIKSTLNKIPIYFISFFRIPKKVVHKLVTLQRRFL